MERLQKNVTNKLEDIRHEKQFFNIDSYSDIINLPHHELVTRQRMPRINRAASFAPFAALVGYEDAVKEKARFTDKKIELGEDEKKFLNVKLQLVNERLSDEPILIFTYFLSDDRKDGGKYLKHIGVIKRIDEYERKVIFKDKTKIPIDDIYEIDGEIFGENLK